MLKYLVNQFINANVVLMPISNLSKIPKLSNSRCHLIRGFKIIDFQEGNTNLLHETSIPIDYYKLSKIILEIMGLKNANFSDH